MANSSMESEDCQEEKNRPEEMLKRDGKAALASGLRQWLSQDERLLSLCCQHVEVGREEFLAFDFHSPVGNMLVSNLVGILRERLEHWHNELQCLPAPSSVEQAAAARLAAFLEMNHDRQEEMLISPHFSVDTLVPRSIQEKLMDVFENADLFLTTASTFSTVADSNVTPADSLPTLANLCTTAEDSASTTKHSIPTAADPVSETADLIPTTVDPILTEADCFSTVSELFSTKMDTILGSAPTAEIVLDEKDKSLEVIDLGDDSSDDMELPAMPPKLLRVQEFARERPVSSPVPLSAGSSSMASCISKDQTVDSDPAAPAMARFRSIGRESTYEYELLGDGTRYCVHMSSYVEPLDVVCLLFIEAGYHRASLGPELYPAFEKMSLQFLPNHATPVRVNFLGENFSFSAELPSCLEQLKTIVSSKVSLYSFLITVGTRSREHLIKTFKLYM
jgi:hypothetical protein